VKCLISRTVLGNRYWMKQAKSEFKSLRYRICKRLWNCVLKRTELRIEDDATLLGI
jgi:hypothetical protein